MSQRKASKLIVVLLSLNAAIVAFLGLLLLSRTELLPSAIGQMSPASGNSQVIVAPGQLSPSLWGCYVLDTRAGTLCVYQYNPGERLLRLQAARGIEQDLQLRSFNTSPLPSEVAELIEKEQKLQSGLAATRPAR